MAIRGTNGGLTSISQNQILQNFFGPGISDESYIPNIGTAEEPILGQNGFINDYSELDTTTPLVYGQLIPTLIHAPTIFQRYGEDASAKLIRFLKFLIESHATSITGVDVEYTLEVASSPSGLDGQQYKVPQRTTLAEPSPSFTWDELNGNVIYNFIKNWILLMRHNRTQTSSKHYPIQSESPINDISPKPIVSSDISATVLFTQYGSSGDVNDIIDAFLITNMYPTGTTPAGYQRDINEQVKPERSIPFTGVLEHSPVIYAFAQRIHNEKFTENGFVEDDRYDTVINKDRPDYLKSSTASTPT